MKKFRNTIFYITVIGGFSALMYWITVLGHKLETGKNVILPESDKTQWSEFLSTINVNFQEPLAIILIQIITIIVVARIFGWAFKKIGQPAVIGEIIAGIVLGPSLVGAIFPEFYAFLFPAHSFGNLKILSNIGLILFMFVVGMELDLKILKKTAHEAIVISHASIILPFTLGMILAYFLYTSYAPDGIPFSSFGLFMGISMSITAFPVLARIVQEKGLTGTKLGALIITCAAADDITAWCLLAVVIAIVKAGSFLSALYIIFFAVLYVFVMIKIVKPFLNKIGNLHSSHESMNKSVVAIFFLTLLVSAFSTEIIGIHALFGAFMAGAIMPENKNFRNVFVGKVEDVALVLLLPLFFVYTGLRTKIGLINEPELWQVTGWIILVAVVGKFVGSAASGKFVGQSWRESLMVGALMNTRGLMELVVINIGYDLGVLTPEIFAMMVIMALVTTFMTSPSLSIINKIFPEKRIQEELDRQHSEGIFKTLVALGSRANARAFLDLSKTVLDGAKNSLEVTVLHSTVGTNVNPMYAEQFSTESFTEIQKEAETLKIPIQTEYKVTDNIEYCITRTANENNFDFLLVGGGISLSEEPMFKESNWFAHIKWLNRLINKILKHRSVFYPSMLVKDKTNYFVENSNCSVGIFVNRNYTKITNTLIFISSVEDVFLLRYARRLMRNNNEVSIDIYDVNHLQNTSESIAAGIKDLQELYPKSVKLIKAHRNHSHIYQRYSFMLISYPTWTEVLKANSKEFEYIPSTLIISKKASRFTSGRYKNNENEEDENS